MSIQTSYLSPQSQWLDLTGKVLVLRQNSGAIAITTGSDFGWGPTTDGYGSGKGQHGGVGTGYSDYILLSREDYDLIYLSLPPKSGSHNEMHNLVHGRCYGKDKPGAVHAGI